MVEAVFQVVQIAVGVDSWKRTSRVSAEMPRAEGPALFPKSGLGRKGLRDGMEGQDSTFSGTNRSLEIQGKPQGKAGGATQPSQPAKGLPGEPRPTDVPTSQPTSLAEDPFWPEDLRGLKGKDAVALLHRVQVVQVRERAMEAIVIHLREHNLQGPRGQPCLSCNLAQPSSPGQRSLSHDSSGPSLPLSRAAKTQRLG